MTTQPSHYRTPTAATPGNWTDHAACKTPPDTYQGTRADWVNLWFPEQGQHLPDLARDTCNRCTVTNDCLTYAIDTAQPYGAWGGIPARQRRLGGAA